MTAHWISIVVGFPLVGGLLILLLPKKNAWAIRITALTISVVEFALSLPLFFRFDPADAGMQFVEHAPWIKSLTINYSVGIDGLSLFLVVLTTVLIPFAVLASWSVTSRLKEYFLLLLVLETGMIGVFVSLDLILFYVFWEVMLIPMYLLIGVWGHDRRIYASIKFILYTMLGSLLMLVAILWVYFSTGTFSIVTLYMMRSAGVSLVSATAEPWLFLAFFLAFAIKVPLFPFHTWLPDAHVEAPTAGSIVLAGVLLKMGGYGLLRFCLPLFPDATREFAPFIAALAIIGIIYGALVSWVQPDLKKLIAYSSVAHMGFVVAGIMAVQTVSVGGAVFQMLSHGVTTGLLFAMVGMLYDRRHTHLIADFGGIAKCMPKFSAIFVLACLSSLGLPPLSGFVGEFLILIGLFQVSPLQAALAALGVILAALYLLSMVQRLLYGPITHEVNRDLPDLTRRELAIVLPLAALMIWMGLASPVFTTRIEPTVNRIIGMTHSPHYERARSDTDTNVTIDTTEPVKFTKVIEGENE